MPSISKIGLGTRLAVSNVLQIAAFISVLTFVFLREERQALEEVSTGVGERSEAIQADQARHLETLVGDRTRSAADTLDAKGRSLAGLVASAAAPAVRTPDPAVLDEVCRRACRDEDVVLCYVAGADGSILSRFRNHEDAIVRKRFDVQGLESVESTARSMLSSGGVREIQEDVVLDGQRLGRVVLLLSDRAVEAYRDALGGRAAELRTEVGATFDAMRTEIDASVEARTDRALRLAASVAAGFFLIGVVGTYLYSRTIIAPLLRSVDSLGTASGELSGVSEQMSSNAGDVARKANEASAASEHVNRNAETVAAAVEEMSVSIREIARNAANAAEIARSAVEAADSANATVAKLGESGTEIDNVIKVITSIAEQTNLLALNATIEAARAGEAGKGFSVVANEVKELAKETARATEDISNRIEGIQSDTRAAVEAIGRISLIINQISDFQNSIATAVEEQTATTNEIGRSTADTVRMTSEITRYIGEVASVSQSTMAGVQRTRQAATALAKTAAELHFLVGSHHGNGAPRPDGARPDAWSS